MATVKIHEETSISAWIHFMITEVHCQSTKILTNNVYNVRLVDFEVSMASVHQMLQRTIKQTLPQNADCR